MRASINYSKALIRGFVSVGEAERLPQGTKVRAKTLGKHAPHAPGPRPGTWWKQIRHLREPWRNRGNNDSPIPVYTRPSPRDLHAEKEAARKAAVKKARGK